MAFWMAAASVWGVLQLLLLTWPVRTVRWPTVFLAFGVGAYGCGVASTLVELVTARQLAASRHESVSAVLDTVSWTTAPLAEELIKIAPLLLAGWALRGRVQWGIADFAVLGGALGAGFSLLEELLMYAGSGAKAVPLPSGGWQIPATLTSQVYVPGPGDVLGHWFPAPTGVAETGGLVVRMPYDMHVFASVLAGVGVGLLLCGAGWLVRFCAVLPVAGAVTVHWVHNYAAVFPDHETAGEWRDRLTGSWGLWIILGCLALAWVWGVRAVRRGAGRVSGVRLEAERPDPGGVQALLAFALLKPPVTLLIALGYARQRRALLYAAAHPRTRPEKLERLRTVVAERTRRLDLVNDEAAWRGRSLSRLRRDARRQRPGLPAHEKVLLCLTLLLAVPSTLYLAVGSLPSAHGVQTYFTDGTGLRLLIGCALAGMVLTAWRLGAAAYGYRAAARRPLAEDAALVQLRIAVCAGALVTGGLLLYRWEAVASGAEPLEVYETLGARGFLLEKLVRVGLPLLLMLAMFALPYALPLELLMGGGLAETLLMAAAPRLLGPVVARVGTRLAVRGATQWARGAMRGGRQSFARGRHRIRRGRTDPVDLATGRMFLPLTDIELPGVLPLVFSRRADSGYRGGRWFGPGWASTADQRLESDEQGVVFFTEDGQLLAYPHPVAGGAPVLPAEGERWPLSRLPDGTYTITDPDTGRTLTFAEGPEGGTAPLRRISDRHSHAITFHYAPDGSPTEIVHSGGYRLGLDTTDGRITGLRLARTGLLTYGYTDGHLTETVNSCGLPLRFTYDAEGRITSWTDTNDRSYAYTYDERDRVTAEGGEGGHYTFRFTYEGSDPDFPGLRVTTLTSPEEATSRYLIDDRHQVVGEIDPNGAVTRTAYDDAGRTIAQTDGLGHTTGFRYDGHGHLTAVIRPDGTEITATLDTHGNPLRITDPAGAVTHGTFDEAGNRTSLTDPSGRVTRYTYTANGALIAVTDPLGATTRIRCDAAGLPIEVTDPLGATTHYRRDAFGRVVTVTDPVGATTTCTWSVEGHLLHRRGPDGATESWTYDGEGNRTTHTDALGQVTHYEYTHFDLLTARTDPDGSRHTFTHDAEARLTQVSNPQGLTWTYGYDPAGRLRSETDFDGRTLTYAHDQAGRLTAHTDPLGQVTRYTHDALGRVLTKDAAGLRTTYRWSPAGDLLRATGLGTDVRRSYDPSGRLTAETVNGRTLALRYDPAGNLAGRETPTGAHSTYTHDLAGQRTVLTTSGRTLTHAFDPAGQETTRTWNGVLSLAQGWDRAGRITTQAYATEAPLVRHTHTWRPDGHLAATDDTRYTLDATGRVTHVNAATWQESYAYDQAGNQTEAAWSETFPHPEATGARTYTGTRIRTAGSIRYAYDAAGRTTLRQKTRLSRKPDTWRYTWDAEDRLTRVVTPDGTAWHYAYDPLGRRTTKQRLASDGTVAEETVFTWHGSTLIEQTTTSADWPGRETLTWDHDPTGLTPLTQATRYTPAADAPQSETDTRFHAIVTDLIGTPTHLVDESGHVAWHARATLWGTTTWNHDAAAYIPLRFPGQYHDLETGHHYNLHRHYDPETARYLTPDPLGLGPAPHPVAYVHNPHTWIDPLGLAPDYPRPGDGGPGRPGPGPRGLPAAGTISPRAVRFSQDSINERFKNGRSVDEVIEDLRAGNVTADQFPAIRIFERDGAIHTLDNRRLHVFREAGVDIKFVRATPQQIENEAWKFTTRNNGTSINVRRR